MNILIISLLRAGDLMMHIKATADHALRSNDQIYLVTHRQNKGLEFLYPWIKKVFYFDRELVQKSQKEDFLPVDSGFQHTLNLVSEINQLNINTIYNFTNTKISAIFMSVLSASEKIGLCYDGEHFFVNDPSHWIKYLNNSETSKFHLIDIFKNSIINKSPLNAIVKNENSFAKEKTICIQALTSDPKKNWPLVNFKKLIDALKNDFEDYRIQVLCAASEKDKLFAELPEHHDKILVSSYQEAYALIQRSQLLISGDTSIKHLGSFTNTPILELALGSAQPHETGLYSENGFVLYNPIACQPCKHTATCNKDLTCTWKLEVAEVIAATKYILKRSNSAPAFMLRATFNRNSILNYELISGSRSGALISGRLYAQGF